MERLIAQLAYRAKAVAAAFGLALVAAAEYVVEAPATAHVLAQAVPAPWAQLVPVALGAIAVGIVHAVPNGPRPAAVGAAAAPKHVPAHLASGTAVQAPTAAPVPAPAAAGVIVDEPAPATSMVQLVPLPSGGN